jgi:Ni,Fe-hydrogenase III component G
MAAEEWNETRLKSLIKDTMKQELKELRHDIEGIIEKQNKKTDDAQVREIVRSMIVNLHKFMWQKSSTYIKQI